MDGMTRDRKIEVRVSSEEKSRIRAHAAQEWSNISSWVRQLVMRVIAHQEISKTMSDEELRHHVDVVQLPTNGPGIVTTTTIKRRGIE